MFLFSELLVLTRPVTRNERSCFQVYRQPIPVRDLALEDLQDGDIRVGGSFRGAFTNGERGGWSCAPPPGLSSPLLSDCSHFCVSSAKNVFRVSSLQPALNQCHTLYVNDVYHKQQWLNCLRTAMAQQQGAPPRVQPGEAATAQRRSPPSAGAGDQKTDENLSRVSVPKLRPQTLSKTRLEQKSQGPVKRKETGV